MTPSQRPLSTRTKQAAMVFALALAGLWPNHAGGARPDDATGSAPALRVLVDPGHGGADRGAVRGDLRESQITLRIALKLAEKLRADPRFEVELTRDSDKQVPLAERTRRAKTWKADVLLSIHANSNEDPHAAGVEIYFQNQLAADEESLFLAARENGEITDPRDARAEEGSERGDLANIIEDLRRLRAVRSSLELSRILLADWPAATPRRSSRAVRQAPFYLVSHRSIPAVLVEVGFITNAIEGPRLNEPGYQERVAQQLFSGLGRFKETVDKDRGRPLESAHAL